MPASTVRIPTPHERAAQLAQEERALAARVRRWWVTRIAGLFGSCMFGLMLVAWSLHTTNQRWAAVAFWAGLLLGNVGMFVTLIVTAIQANDEGLF